MKARKLFFKECHLAGRQYHDADEGVGGTACRHIVGVAS